MNKHVWRLFVGCLVLFIPFLFLRLLRFVLGYLDEAGRDIFLVRLWAPSAPFVGLVLLTALIYFLGWFRETRPGIWLSELIIERIPFFGKMLISPNVESQAVLQRVSGFVFGPIWGGFRPARVTAVFKTATGEPWVVLTFPMFPAAAVQSYPASTVIYAVERQVVEGGSCFVDIAEKDLPASPGLFSAFSTEYGLRIEFTGGTTVPADAFWNLRPVTLKEFLKSYELL